MWKRPPEDRLAHWKQFRKELDTLEFDEALTRTVEFWSTAPFTPYYLDYTEPDNWPDPWQLIYENYYCDLAKALGILYTLHLSTHGAKHNIGLKILEHIPDKFQYNLVWIDDGKYVLNLEDTTVVNKKSIEDADYKVLVSFTSEELRLESY